LADKKGGKGTPRSFEKRGHEKKKPSHTEIDGKRNRYSQKKKQGGGPAVVVKGVKRQPRTTARTGIRDAETTSALWTVGGAGRKALQERNKKKKTKKEKKGQRLQKKG